ncbi:MAG: hypothetical protein LBL45_10380 [Treponema sp.]|jgi:hypothetical protein|nr:hypothetical protein [Treponema sp.]
MIKYKYANNNDGYLTDINSISRDKKYYCISCGQELIPKTGKIRQWHFAHKNVEIVCSQETHLHILGKQVFYNTYKNCIDNKEPFYIEIEQKKICNCYKKELNKVCKLLKTEKIDITKYFSKIFYEKKVEDFIPDLYVSNESANELLFIEIAVTHTVTDKKHDSKYRIIEIQMETEDDIIIIANRLLSKHNDKIKFINFKDKEISGNFCNRKCKASFHYLNLDKHGRVLLKTRSLSEIVEYISFDRNNILKYDIQDINYMHEGDAFKLFVANCAMENLKVRNCFICRYHALNSDFVNFSRKHIIQIML